MTTTTSLGAGTLMGATLATAMVAGLLFSFAHSVMPGLGTLDDRGFLLLHLSDRTQAVPWLVVGLVLAVATVSITGAIHLPLNAAIRDAAPAFLDGADLRSRFEGRWVRWNVVRTVTSTGSLAALSWALFGAGRSAG